MIRPNLPSPVVLLGVLGVAPQLALLLAGATHAALRAGALVGGGYYAAVILSFLGGLWWMQALLLDRHEAAPYLWGVVPSLAAWGIELVWHAGWASPRLALALLGGLVLASPLVDSQLDDGGLLPLRWLRLRVVMASGLGLSTLALASL